LLRLEEHGERLHRSLHGALAEIRLLRKDLRERGDEEQDGGDPLDLGRAVETKPLPGVAAVPDVGEVAGAAPERAEAVAPIRSPENEATEAVAAAGDAGETQARAAAEVARDDGGVRVGLENEAIAPEESGAGGGTGVGMVVKPVGSDGGDGGDEGAKTNPPADGAPPIREAASG
jgi:hypothetical protein